MCVAELQELFELFWLLEAVDVVAVLPRRDAVSVFTFFPYRERCHHAGTPVQVDQWPRVRFYFVKVSLVDAVVWQQRHGVCVPRRSADLVVALGKFSNDRSLSLSCPVLAACNCDCLKTDGAVLVCVAVCAHKGEPKTSVC
jgi:hypothetical protein